MSGNAPLFIGVSGRDDEHTPAISGAKAALAWRIAQMGLPVPPAFALPTTLCAGVNRGEPQALEALDRGLRDGIARLEQAMQRRFGDLRRPLLVSVRSGAAQSMPGMLATVLNVGLNGDSVRGLIGLTGNPRLAWDSYRRFVQNYAETVLGTAPPPYDACRAAMVRAEGVDDERNLDPEALERLTGELRGIAGRAIPDEPMDQLRAAARAVYRSWDGARAAEYRRLYGLDAAAGTAVMVQAMVFGNAGGASGAGVAFSRNPATGAKELYVDFLFDAQGEDVVAGRRSPTDAASLAVRLPRAANELAAGVARLEREFRDVQDVEFTVEEGKLFFLQTRAAKRTPLAALRILVDLVREGVIDETAALARAASVDLERAKTTRFADAAPAAARAIAASPGVASGRVAFDSARIKAVADGAEPVILVRHDTSTDDVAGFAAATGILTATGGRTAHAAVVARQLGKVCLVGCRELTIDEQGRSGAVGGRRIAEGDWVSLDGESGEVSLGRREIVADVPRAELAEIESWRRLRS